MRTTLIIVSLLLGGCATYPLGTSYAEKGQSHDQTVADVGLCKDQAAKAANTPESFLQGMTIVGAPSAMEKERLVQRTVFKDCMNRKGYYVSAP